MDLSAWQVLDSVGESFAIVDRDFRIVWARDPLLSQVKPDFRPVGQFCYKVFLDRDTPCPTNCPVAPVFRTGRPQTAERSFIGPQGEPRWREARAYPIVDRRGQVAFAARISFDITRRKQTQAQQERRTENLERSLEELTRLQLGELPFQPLAQQALTGREMEVLRLLAQGLPKPQIGGVLGISPNTVKRHVTNIFNKLGVNDRAQAAVWAARQGLV